MSRRGGPTRNCFISGASLLRVRQLAQLTQKEVASRIKVNPKTVSEWERTDRKPKDPKQIKELAKLFHEHGVSAEQLVRNEFPINVIAACGITRSITHSIEDSVFSVQERVNELLSPSDFAWYQPSSRVKSRRHELVASLKLLVDSDNRKHGIISPSNSILFRAMLTQLAWFRADSDGLELFELANRRGEDLWASVDHDDPVMLYADHRIRRNSLLAGSEAYSQWGLSYEPYPDRHRWLAERNFAVHRAAMVPLTLYRDAACTTAEGKRFSIARSYQQITQYVSTQYHPSYNCKREHERKYSDIKSHLVALGPEVARHLLRFELASACLHKRNKLGDVLSEQCGLLAGRVTELDQEVLRILRVNTQALRSVRSRRHDDVDALLENDGETLRLLLTRDKAIILPEAREYIAQRAIGRGRDRFNDVRAILFAEWDRVLNPLLRLPDY